MTEGRSRLQFDDNALVPVLFGEHDQNLARLEEQLGVSLASFGNEVRVTGPDAACDAAGQALEALYERLKCGLIVGDAEVDAAARLAKAEADGRAASWRHCTATNCVSRPASATSPPARPGKRPS